MFKITIEGATMEQVTAQIASLYAMSQQAQVLTETPAPKTTMRKPPKAIEPEPITAADIAPTQSDAVDAELLEVLEPAPNTANTVVDAGTGKPVAKPEPVKQMTFDDVKVAAAKLAQQDTPALKALIEKYGGTNLSSIPKEKLGDFAADVLAAVG